MNPKAQYIVLVVSESNLNPVISGPGFEDIDEAIAHAAGVTSDPQQRLAVGYIIPVEAVVVQGSDTDVQFEDDNDNAE